MVGSGVSLVAVSHVKCMLRALGKREYLMIIQDNFSYFSLKPYVVTPHLNCLIEMVQKRGHNIFFNQNLPKLSLIIAKYSLLSRALHAEEKIERTVKRNTVDPLYKDNIYSQTF